MDFLFQLTDHTGMNPIKLVVALTEDDPLVAAAENDVNQRMSTYQFFPPLDPSYRRQWHLHQKVNDPDFDHRSSTRTEDAWERLDGFGSADVVVAVTDDGCKLGHGDFDSGGKFAEWGYLRGSRLVTSGDIDADPDEMYKTGSNHGTSRCGVIAGEVDGALTVGAAPGCRLLPIQWESDGPSLFISDSKLLTVLNFIADKVDVMSNSWGSSPNGSWPTPVLNRIQQLSETGGRRGKGTVFLWAAGNEACPIEHTLTQNVPFTSGFRRVGNSFVWIGVRTSKIFRHNLTSLSGVMHVAALASTARRSDYSNYGTGVLITAPPSNVHKYRRLTVRGLGITTTTGDPVDVIDSFGGTSSATPLVAGIAALTISANPDLDAAEVISIMKRTASNNLDFQEYPRTPPASFDSNTSWDISPVAPFDSGVFNNSSDPDGTWSPWFGHGRIDALNAVDAALSRRAAGGASAFSGSTAPDQSIPDNSNRGIKSKIACPDDFTLETVTVDVSITHTFIADLKLTLISPSGTAVVLHDRQGGNADNIDKTYDLRNTPGLTAFADEPVDGDWTLHVQDLARFDRGRLKSWSIGLTGRANPVIEAEDSPGLTIPDNAPIGLRRVLTLNSTGTVSRLSVDIDIAHTFIQDLSVRLEAPGGAEIVLHNRTGGNSDNIIRTYSPENTLALQALRGVAINGDWTLHVRDHASADIGKLNRWALKVEQD